MGTVDLRSPEWQGRRESWAQALLLLQGISDSRGSPWWGPQPSFLRVEHCRAVPIPWNDFTEAAPSQVSLHMGKSFISSCLCPSLCCDHWPKQLWGLKIWRKIPLFCAVSAAGKNNLCFPCGQKWCLLLRHLKIKCPQNKVQTCTILGWCSEEFTKQNKTN